MKGRTVRLDVKIIEGRLVDVLQLAVKAKKPVMLGAIAMQAALLLPPGDAKVIDRLQLDGRFALEHVQFTAAEVQTKFAEMSKRAQGKPPDGPAETITTDMRGRFVLKDGAIRLEPLEVLLPGAAVSLVGVYGIRSEGLDFTGTVGMDATISQAAGGGRKGSC